jgi:threonylcarbamoyladenosine tRNA methylthiotransferase MtaB
MTTFYIEQFGCRATQADGAAIERQLRDQGFRAEDNRAAADIVVLNTCTVTAAADTQARDAIRKIHAANPRSSIIVTGCYAQRAPEELATLPGVSLVVGNSHKPQIPSLANRFETLRRVSSRSEFLPVEILGSTATAPKDRSAQILTGDVFALTDVLVAPVLGGEGNHTRPTLKIQDGCNSRCSFCVIPFVRGRSRSLPSATVLSELERLANSGFKEIVLSGINLGTYGRDLSPRVDFLELLGRILGETAVERLRISSIEPLDVSEDLIGLFASTERIAPHFHMPLQSGSDRILAAMHRWYRAEHYARRVELIRERLPNAALGGDVICGFPGETEAEHQATMRFIEERSFTYLHVFSYSSRPGTKAASMTGHIPGHRIKRRARELRALGEAKAKAFRRSQIGRRLSVLTLRRGAKDGSDETMALAENYVPVKLFEVLPPNQFLTVVAASLDGSQLLGSPLDASVSAVVGAA